MRTYAIADVHGCVDKLDFLLALCNDDAGSLQKRVILLGDYIDRGDDSRRVIDLLIQRRADGDNLICLTGNHEQLALLAIHDPAAEIHWKLNGGIDTLVSYGVQSASALPQEHISFMRSLPTHFDDGIRYFVHAGIRPGRALAEQAPDDLVWIREPFLSSNDVFERYIVHGHTPLPSGKPDVRHNRVNLDTGAVYDRPLTAAIFEINRVAPVGFIQTDP